MPEPADTAEWVGTGTKVKVEPGRAEFFDAASAEKLRLAELAGTHLWMAMVFYHVQPWDGLMLDHENLASQPMVGCFRCGEPYTDRLRHRRCPGDKDPWRTNSGNQIG